ncbi:hypothetical protein Csa_023084 [Cucumis sativus]|uniref:Uncharacterized protein n=1 Tax=Cucumis sativus TaxID=3659 RepID=A0A0A0KT63_CUCSA|nr:hypothetical protein Csa_023084 [Cucumis sativus]
MTLSMTYDGDDIDNLNIKYRLGRKLPILDFSLQKSDVGTTLPLYTLVSLASSMVVVVSPSTLLVLSGVHPVTNF